MGDSVKKIKNIIAIVAIVRFTKEIVKIAKEQKRGERELQKWIKSYRKIYVFRCPNCGKIIKKARQISDILGKVVTCDGIAHDDQVSREYRIKREDLYIF